MKKESQIIWVLEMKCNGKWEPTAAIGLWEGSLNYTIKVWENHNPGEKFRISEYTRKGKT
jgi:hypothetical protein